MVLVESSSGTSTCSKTFLHGELHEVIYMKPLPRYNQAKPDMVYRLRESLYGLKQAKHAWFEKFQSTIIKAGFSQSVSDY